MPLLAINSADDQVNPPELGILERTIESLPTATCVVLPITDETRGHGTHTVAKLWKHHLVELLEKSRPSDVRGGAKYSITMNLN